MENETYNGWLFSNSLIKRSLAVVGHYMLGSLIIMAVLAIPTIVLGLLIFSAFQS